MLYTMEEIRAVLNLLNRTPMTQAEQLYTQTFFERLVAFCTPPNPEPQEEEKDNGHG